MQRRVAGHEEGWLLSYADLITNLLLFFVVLLSAANLSKSKMQQISKAISGEAQPESLESIQKEIDKTIAEKGLSDIVTTKFGSVGLHPRGDGPAFGNLCEQRAPFDPAWPAPVEHRAAAQAHFASRDRALPARVRGEHQHANSNQKNYELAH